MGWIWWRIIDMRRINDKLVQDIDKNVTSLSREYFYVSPGVSDTSVGFGPKRFYSEKDVIDYITPLLYNNKIKEIHISRGFERASKETLKNNPDSGL